MTPNKDNMPGKAKSVDEILLEAHGDRDFNYTDIKRAFHIYGEQMREEYLPYMMGKQQLSIYNKLVKSPAIETGAIASWLSIPSKSVSSQLSQIMKRTGLIGFERIGKLKYWYKN